MKERSLFRTSDQSFVVGIGRKSQFELNDLSELRQLDQFVSDHQSKTLFVFINFQLGNTFFDLPKKNNQLPLLFVYEPESIYQYKDSKLIFCEGEQTEYNFKLAYDLFTSHPIKEEINWKPQISKLSYLENVTTLKNQIQAGNIYEVNYCQEIESTPIHIESIQPLFNKIFQNNPTPYASMYECKDWMFASASPELYLEKKGGKLISKPIKGTAKRGENSEKDQLLKTALENDSKERSENIMIVDLVRNDLSKIAQKGSVFVDELCQIYSFPTVHQMISTVSCNLKPNTAFSKIIQATFPMGSMTGAPKKAALEYINEYENFSRECYSGSFGIISPNGDFELNVLIRTLFYQSTTNKLTCGVGGAITIHSNPESEYQECKTKVEKIINYFGPCHWY